MTLEPETLAFERRNFGSDPSDNDRAAIVRDYDALVKALKQADDAISALFMKGYSVTYSPGDSGEPVIHQKLKAARAAVRSALGREKA